MMEAEAVVFVRCASSNMRNSRFRSLALNWSIGNHKANLKLFRSP